MLRYSLRKMVLPCYYTLFYHFITQSSSLLASQTKRGQGGRGRVITKQPSAT